MRNVLIDTCSWIDLLTEDTNNLLPHLEFWSNNECINIISHEIIIEEWNKHKIKQKKRFSDSLKTKYKHTQEIGRKEKLSIPERLEPNIQNIEEQINLIDRLLDNSIILNASDATKILCSDRTISKKAPFHNKLDSTKDAYIIFSAIEYFIEQNQGFLFVSSNKNEFGSPGNLELEIHPEITENFSGINISYFNDIGRAINYLKQDLPITMVTDNVDNINNIELEDKIFIDKTKPILDQIFDYINIRHKEVFFYPLNLFSNQYPFKTKTAAYPYYSHFSLSFNNPELFDLFKSVDISKGNLITINNPKFYMGVKDYESKIKKVLSGLTQNLIFNISNEKTRERLSVRYSDETNCQCSKCNYIKFKFVQCFNSLDTYSENSILESGYLHYQIGNFVTSANLQLKATELFTVTNRNLSNFISQFNSSKLSNFIRIDYYGENCQESLVQKLKKIDLNYSATLLSNKEDGDFINYLNNDKFYINARNKIQKTTSRIIDHYYNQLNGGWSSNSEVWFLINEYAKLESFLNGNFILYDKFNEYKELFTVFIEGLFASHGINESHYSRLENLDDWLINQILRYGDAKIINKFFKRYKLKNINYKKTSFTGDSFVDLIDNFFSNEGLRDAFIQNCEKTNRRFWEYYNTIFQNILTLVSICDFDTNYYNLFTKKLIVFLEDETYLHPLSYNYINIYLIRCGKQIEEKLLVKFFELGLNKSSYHNPDFFDSLSKSFKSRKINVSKSQFLKIKILAFEHCKICKEKHDNTIIIPFCQIMGNTDYKIEIGNIILQRLNNSFSFNLFYLASIFDIIKLDKVLLKRAIVVSLPKDKRTSFKSVFTDIEENRFDLVNSLLNLCFKFNIDTTSDEFKPFMSIDKYYEWLIDMDNFNYNLFQKSWISEYSTSFYFEKIYYSELTKNKLDEILKNNFDSKLERDYLNIYIRKTWQI